MGGLCRFMERGISGRMEGCLMGVCHMDRGYGGVMR